jgi:transketolase
MEPICKEIRKDVLQASLASGHGHIPTSFSIIELIYSAYQVMKHDSKNPSWPERDIFILSKGHGSLGLYCVLAKLGYFETERVKTFGGFMSIFGCHPDRLKVPGVEVSTGSLGHGIGVGVGMALGLKIKKSSRRVFVLIGDGEANEGSVWESIMVAADQKLANLTILYDNNLSQLRCLNIRNPLERFRAFETDAVEVEGHDVDQLTKEIEKRSDRVRAIVANTQKGHGCKTLVENVYEWHRRSPNEAEYRMLLEELSKES